MAHHNLQVMEFLNSTRPLAVALAALTITVTSAQSWVPQNANSLGWRFEDIFFVDENTGWAVDGGGQILKSTNGGVNWTQQHYNGNHYFRSVEFFDANEGFAGTLGSIMLKTTDGGNTWVDISANLPVAPNGICGMSAVGDSTIYITGVFYGPGYIMKSADRGQTWTYTDMTSQMWGSVDIHFKNEQEGFVVGQTGQGNGLRAVILRTTNGGGNWTQVAVGPDNNERAWKIQFLNDTVAYVSVEELSPEPNYFKTTDGGLTWQNINITTTVTSGTVQGVGFLNENLGWLGGFNDLFFETVDGGQTWTHQPTTGTSFNRFWRVNETTMLVGGSTVYKYSDTSLDLQESAIVTRPPGHQFGIQGANPVSGPSVIELDLVNDTYCELSIYDLKGKRVQTIDTQMRSKGPHQVQWDASGLAPGNYLLALYTYHGFESVQISVEN